MNKYYKVGGCLLVLCLLTGCTSTPTEDLLGEALIRVFTAKKTSRGNKAQCNHYKMTCAQYREWIEDNDIACSCKN